MVCSRREGVLVDFSEALKARIKNMSSVELTAIETRRRTREGGETDRNEIEAFWASTADDGAGAAAASKMVTVRLDPGAAGARDALTFSHDPSWRETILLTPAVYRLLAGGQLDDADGAATPRERFILGADGPTSETVSASREAVAQIVGQERPRDMIRARRLFDLERLKPASLRLPVERRVALFAERWVAEDIKGRIDAAVAGVSSRAMLLMTGRDQVALWIRPGDLVQNASRFLQADLAPSILLPKATPRKEPSTAEHDAYAAVGHGTGPERVLLVDLARFRKTVCLMDRDEDRDIALEALRDMTLRDAVIAQERRGPRARHRAS